MEKEEDSKGIIMNDCRKSIPDSERPPKIARMLKSKDIITSSTNSTTQTLENSNVTKKKEDEWKLYVTDENDVEGMEKNEEIEVEDDDMSMSSSDNSDMEEISQSEREEEEDKKKVETMEASSFLFRSPVTKEEAEVLSQSVRERIEEAQKIIKEFGYDHYVEMHNVPAAEMLNGSRDHDDNNNDPNKISEDERERVLSEAVVRGHPRAYQTALYELSKHQNTIVHLGTGQGKTLIALLCIRHFASQQDMLPPNQLRKQTLFLVPSIALAVQHTITLQANLPFSVSTACHTSAKSFQARLQLSQSDIIVATHGAAKDLLMHYSDLFHLTKVCLIVVDECHYATGEHGYAKIFDNFYHRLPKEQRPRVLGLTASPLLNVRKDAPNDLLHRLLDDLETRLDATLACFRELGLTRDTNAKNHNSLYKPSGLIPNRAQERPIHYHSSFTPQFPLFPPHLDIGLHAGRIKEMNRLQDLYSEFGPLCTAIYTNTLSREISRNRYDQETATQFRKMVSHLKLISKFCWRVSQSPIYQSTGGRTEKMALLEELLQDIIESKGAPNTVGVVFVDRRITALAIYDYFLARTNGIKLACMDPKATPPPWIPISQTKWTRRIKHHQWQQAFQSFHNNPLFATPTENSTYIDNNSPNEEGQVTLNYFTSKFEGTTNYNAQEMFDAIVNDVINSSIPPHLTTKDLQSIPFSKQYNENSILYKYSANAATSTKNNCDDENDSNEHYYNPHQTIRCDMLVRQTTQVFKYLDKNLSVFGAEEEKLAHESWLHQMKKIRGVLDGLRRKEINVLIATSVVEEGVDVDACSFVIVLDHLKSTKSYVQMKGRARQKKAKFYVFQNSDPKVRSPYMTLNVAQETEKRISEFIESRGGRSLPLHYTVPKLGKSFLQWSSIKSNIYVEELAAEQGEYHATKGMVDLTDSRSLLNRYTFSIPFEATSRLTREILMSHMPVFEENRLFLPAHLPSAVRCVNLPAKYYTRSRKDKANIMALMACVRLHKLKLLNERMLPLKRKDIQQKLLSIALTQLAEIGEARPLRSPPRLEGETKTVYIYSLVQEGPIFSQNDEVLKGKGRRLAIVCLTELPQIPFFVFEHPELAKISCEFRFVKKTNMNKDQWTKCARFYTALINVRWRRRTGTFWYKYNLEKAQTGVLDPYTVTCLTAQGDLDWARMERTLYEYARTDEEKIDAVRNFPSNPQQPDLVEPRIWTPIYDRLASYVVSGPSPLQCNAPFPDTIEGVKTYHDYIVKRREFEVSESSRLFCVQQLWHLPRRVRKEFVNSSLFQIWKAKNIEKEITATDDTKLQNGERALCQGLVAALLPQGACLEAPIPDASLFLNCLILPQILYHLTHILTGHALIAHCREYLPKLGKYLQKVKLENVLEAITARSCSMDGFNYDKLEWIGDAVLKLIHTDVLLNSKDLRKWVGYLHEGDLTLLRSAMGYNRRLMEASKSAGLDRYILIVQLGRGQWAGGICLESCTIDEDGKERKCDIEIAKPGKKVCADVLESLLGLVYMHFGYKASYEVCEELGVTLPMEPFTDFSMPSYVPKQRYLNISKSFMNIDKFQNPHLLEEALTHPSCIHEEVPCYQRLEWVGDAVLCMFAREWVYKNYTDLHVSEMVIVETTIVCNETLAYLNVHNGIQRHINHRDPSLPSRIEDFEWDVGPSGRGLWSTDPPKALPDVVEALFGAAHLDAGFARGQLAVAYAMKPILEAINRVLDATQDNEDLRQTAHKMMHPKQFIHELAGGVVQVRVCREEFMAIKKNRVKIWKHGVLDDVIAIGGSNNGNDSIGLVSCFGIDLLAVAESSPHLCKNRACALAVEVFVNNPDLIEKLQSISSYMKGKDESSSETIN